MSKKTIKAMHYLMLLIMLHITFIVPAQEVAIVYKETFNRLKLHNNLYLVFPQSKKNSTDLYNNSLNRNNSSVNTFYKKNNTSDTPNALNNGNEVKTINADLKEGLIGISKSIPMDNPMDNLFKFNINEPLTSEDKVVLKYDLFGVEDQNSVARSINDRFSIGGHIINTNNQWSSQEEELNPDWLNIGENKILFTTEKGADYQYRIKNVHFEVIKNGNKNTIPLLVVQNTDIKFSKDNKIYVKGFIRGSQDENITIDVEGTVLKQQSLEFEGFIDLNTDILKKGFVVVRAYGSNGVLSQQIVSLSDKLEQAQGIYSVQTKKTSKKVFVKAFEKSTVAIEGASIEIADSALVQTKQISISELRNVDFAPLGTDITNVTKFELAYRFLPDGTVFAKPVPITLSFDPKLLPFGYTAKDIKTFFFDTKTKTWQTIPVLSIDEKNNTITALTTHFTDYVNGIIKAPESPETNAYTPTSLSGIKIANPGEKINLIEPPTANQQGDANLSYPIEIPSGRNGMQPSLAVSYSSSNSNGWMGLGWNLSTPSIELDTRWGSPTFDSATETEIYSLSGEQLLLKSGTNFYLPNKGNPIGRVSNAMFYERVEGGFNKIQRMGSSPSNYYWLVTDKSGTVYTYGTSDAILSNNAGNIARWMLKKVQDTDGNYLEYFYTTKSFTDPVVSSGKQIYLQRIEYTKHASLAAPYSIVFNTTTAVPANSGSFTREDKSINARLGFKEITDDVLQSIEVKYGANLVRKYQFVYKQGVFKKTLLDKIQQYDGAGQLFNEHSLEYYDDTNNGQNIFGSEVSLSGLSNDGGDLQSLVSTTLGASHTSSNSAELGATVGFVNSLFFIETLIPISQSGTGGVTGGVSSSNTSGKITFLDVDGDGLPDKLFNSSSLGYRKNLGNNSFSSAISIPTMNEFTRSDSFSKSLGVKGNFTSGVFAGAERVWTNSYTNSYLEDVNGDGLIDVVKDRKVFFNSLNSSATPTFTTLSSDTPNIIYQGLTSPPVANTLPTPILNNPVFDVVKVWRAPYTGTVAITGTVTLSTTPVTPADGVYFSIETGNFLNEFPLPDQTSTVSTSPISVVSGYPVVLNGSTPSIAINSTISVTKGQRIYFRANTISNDKDDLINFNTNQIVINYTTPISTVSTMPNANQLDAEQLSYISNNASNGFVVSAEQKVNLPKNGNYLVSYPAFTISNPTATGVTIPELSDEVQLLIEKHTRTIVTNPSDNSVVSDNDVVSLLSSVRIKVNTSLNSIPAFSIPGSGDVVSSIDTDNSDNSTTQVYYLFKIDGKSNVDWKKLNDLWKPKIVMPLPDNTVPGSTTTDVYPIPYLSIYNEKVSTTDSSVVTPSIIDKYANYIIPPSMNTGTSTTRKTYQMQPVFPTVSGVNKFNSCSTCSSNSQIRKLYLSVKGSNKNLLFHNTSATNTTMPTPANQLINLAKYEISIDYDGNIISTSTGSTNSGIKRFNTTTGLYDINITGTTSSTVPQSTLINIIFDAIDNGTTTPTLISNNRVYFEYFTDDVDLTNSLANVSFGSARIQVASASSWTYANNTSTNAIYPNIFFKKGNNDFGSNYKNWGQFAYKTEKTGTTTIAIRESELIPNAPLTSAQQTAAQNAISACGSASPALSDSDYQTCVEEALYPPATNPLRRIFRLIPDASYSGSTYYKRWKGSQTQMFVAEKEMSPKNKYDDSVPTPNFPIPTITSSSEAFGIVKETKSTSNSVTVGAGIGAFTNFGDNKVLNDHRDINGDNYPDFIDEGSFQLTNKLGNLYPIITSQGYRQDSNGIGWGTTVAGSIPRFNYVPKGSNGTTTNQTSNTGSGKDIGFNGSQTFSSDESKNILLDVNGDGLIDRADVNGVNLNIGGTSSIFEATTNWNYGAVQKGNTASVATGAGVSLFSGSVTFGLGIGTSTSPNPTNNNSETFQDINGDGLVDKIEGSTVRYNLGTTFDNTSTTISNFDKPYQSISANASVNAGFSACFYFPIPVIISILPPVILITGPKYCACGNGSLGYGINSETLQMVDVNGDGYPDIASSSSENELKVRYSTIGRTNMLKTVNRPLGATITMDYAVNNPIDGSKIGNTYKMPYSKWALTSVVLNDGHSGDGQDENIVKFEYSEGVQDRRERTFLGFGVVKTHNMDVSNNVYRTSVSEYATANIPASNLYVGCLDNRIRQYFYKKGILTKTYMLDGLGRKHSEVNYTYKYYNPSIPLPNSTVADYNMNTTAVIPAPTATLNTSSFSDNSRVLPLLTATNSKVWEFDSETAGASSHMKQQFNSIDIYDKYGNVKQFQDKGANLTDSSDDIKVNIQYFYNANNVVDVPMEHRVTNQGVVFRLSRNFIDNIGRVIQIRKYLTTSLTTNYALYDIAYDSYGNIVKVSHPKGALSDPNVTRMRYSYTYEPTTQSYVTNVVDAYGYTSSSTYDLAFGVPTQTTDSNNNVIEYRYDSFGRSTTIKGPYQSTWTIRNDYYPNLAIPVATTAHIDDIGEIYTSTFIDGLQRVIQTKKELQNCSCDFGTTNAYRLSVSGKVYYDEFGRVIKSYLNNEEQNCDGGFEEALHNFSTFADNPNQLTSTDYDYLDRPLVSTVYSLSAGDATTQMSYTFGQDRVGATQFMKQITLPNGNISQSFTDSKGRVTSSNQIGNGDTYWTSFEYNKIDELLNVKDANQAVTYYTYDNFGRKLSVNHPDAGMATYKYDLASRLKESTNANLLALGQKVIYKYDINHLISVLYPSHTVNYKYGTPGAPDNGAGRVIYQSDLTGEQFFKYGKLGEVTENRRIVIDPLGASRTFITQFTFDTWGRIKNLIYPDGEAVKHTYDNGGLITHIENSNGQVYLNKICYDMFEQRATVIYGNGTVTNYSYEPQQLLQEMTVASSAGSVFMDNKYDYDLNTNVTRIDNSASGAALYHLGGTESKRFDYDDFNRLIHSEGIWNGELEDHKYTLDMEYNSLHNILSKVQSHQTAPIGSGNFTDTANSMNNYYSYTGGNHPHAPSTIDIFDPVTAIQSEQMNNTYDANGNLKQISHDDLNTGLSTTRDMYWDEQNRLQAIVENGVAYHYVYDASGERILKSSGSSTNLLVNGDQVTALNLPGDYTMYPSGYIVVGTHDFTKHYYTGSQRIASRIGDLSTVNNFQSFTSNQSGTGSEALKEKAELDSKKQVLQKQLSEIYAKAKLGKPNFNVITTAALDPAEQACEAQYNAMILYWMAQLQINPQNSTDIRKCIEQITATYNNTNSFCQTIAIIKERANCYVEVNPKILPIWWYHPDHLGSSSYLTDFFGSPSHYYNYLPFGEEMLSQNISAYNNIYKFSGKEKDEDTGLSYFGARYYDPKYSFWMSVDPLAEKYASFSPYNYCMQNPLRMVDPDGKAPNDWWKNNKTGKYVWYDEPSDGSILVVTGHKYIGKSINDVNNDFKSSNNFFVRNFSSPKFGDYGDKWPGEIQSDPETALDKYAYSDNILKKGAYDFVDQPYVTFQSLNPFDQNLQHLNGDGVSPKEKLESGVQTISSLLPAPKSEFTLMKALNAPAFSKLFKGTFIASLKPSTRGILNRGLNAVIKKATNEAVILNTSVKAAETVNNKVKKEP